MEQPRQIPVPPNRSPKLTGTMAALLAALLFGASTPLAKLLLGEVEPVLLAGVFYLASGVLLLSWRAAKRAFGRPTEASLSRTDAPWVVGATLAGGILGPLLLMVGLRSTAASTASLLLNLEAVLTALLAWFVFHENVDRRIAAGMVAIVAGGVVLAWNDPSRPGLGAAAIAGACLAWAVDNNLTRRISATDPLQVAGIKGLAAGLVNGAIGLAVNNGALPRPGALAAAAIVGSLGIGVSLTLFIRALRALGTARTGAYFSTAPFLGASLAMVALHEPMTLRLGFAGGLMAAGVWLHLTEHHEHEHLHHVMEHEHSHVHDEHHRHEHSSEAPLGEPHTHGHRHELILHTHRHFPDIHHRHDH